MREIRANLSPEDSDWLAEFGSEFLSMGLDVEVNQAIMNGSWPNAVYVLEHALERAKEQRAKNPDNYE